jgi:hypothetical protein
MKTLVSLSSVITVREPFQTDSEYIKTEQKGTIQDEEYLLLGHDTMSPLQKFT